MSPIACAVDYCNNMESESWKMVECKLLELINKTGYPLVQNNGQRKFGPPPDWTGPAPLKGCEVFIGKLPRETFEDELVPLFSSVGKIYEMRLMMEITGSNRGYGFVTYTNRTDAVAACRQLNGYQIHPGWQIGVVKSVDNCRLFVGGIPKTKTKEEVLVELSKNVDGLVNVLLFKNCFDRRFNRGFAFVEFISHRAAMIARCSLMKTSTKLWDLEVSVDWAEPEPDVDDEKMRQVKVLYVRNILLETTSGKIQEVFENAIGHEIERVKKMYDYCFIHCHERVHAEQAMMKLQNTEIDGAQIEIRWAKPVDRELYKIKKLIKSSTKFNMDPGMAHILLMYKQFKKREHTVASNEGERTGSGSAAESTSGSPTATMMTDCTERILSAPTELDAMCKRYGWAMPQYTCNNFYNMGTEFWFCQLDLTHVGLPLLNPPNSLGPFVSRTCYSKEMAHVDAAEAALKYLKAIRTDFIQPTALQTCQMAPPPMYQPTIMPPMPNYGLPYEYLGPPMYYPPTGNYQYLAN